MRTVSLVCFTTLLAAIAAPGCQRPAVPDSPSGWAEQLDSRSRVRPSSDGGARPADLEEVRLDLGEGVPISWVMIPAGRFTMGSPPGETCREADPAALQETAHDVRLTRALKITATEITLGQFMAVMGHAPAPSPAQDTLGTIACGRDCPALVTWSEAAAFCSRLGAREGLAPCYAAAGSGAFCTIHKDCAPSTTAELCLEGRCTLFEPVAAFDGTTQTIYACSGIRLPTEAEWEYAYRAGTSSAYYNGALAPGDCLADYADANADEIAWYGSNAVAVVHPVGQKRPNAWGLFDMAGNGIEWCHDTGASNLGAAPVVDPLGPAAKNVRVGRGGGIRPPITTWDGVGDHPPYLRAAFRTNLTVEYPGAIRCVRSL